MFKPCRSFLTGRSKAVLLRGSFLLFVFGVCLCHAVMTVSYSHVINCWENADLLVLFIVIFLVFFSLSYTVSWSMCGLFRVLIFAFFPNFMCVSFCFFVYHCISDLYINH